MKKNVMMRIASILLVCVLATTCGISGTFAKYVTSGNVSDTARVAHWGVVITTSGSIFKDQYANDPVIEKDKNGVDIAMTVVNGSSDGKNLVAPGTASTTELVFTISGIPEVAVDVDIQLNINSMVYLAAGEYLDYTTANSTTDTFTLGNTYQPLVFVLKNGADVELASGTIEQIQSYLKNTISGNYAANTNLATELADANADGTYKLSWYWNFEQSNLIYDKADTYLGNVAAGMVTDPNASINADIQFVITVTQVN